MSETTHAAWLGLCELPETLCEKLCVNPFDSIIISTIDPESRYEELTSSVLQVVATKSIGIFIHPFLHQFLCHAVTLMTGDDLCIPEDSSGLELCALPLYETEPISLQKMKCWKIEKTNIVDLDENDQVEVTIIYSDDGKVIKRDIEKSLQGRIIRKNSVIATSIGQECLCILLIKSIEGFEVEKSYRVRKTMKLIMVENSALEKSKYLGTTIQWETHCPGYEALLNDLLELCQTKGFSKPSGLLLSGCKGVGKTRLASCLVSRIVSQNDADVHRVSCHELIMRASWASEADLLDLLLPSKAVALVVLDDLQLLKRDDFDVVDRDMEYLLVRNTIMVAIDRLVKSNTLTLGICETKLELPAELCRAGRLEKELIMEPPTQVQRHTIIQSLLPHQPKWASALAKATAGFVANDLQRTHVDAWARARARDQQIAWSDLREAVHRTVPSQLAKLDVTRPPALSFGEAEDALNYHEKAWAKFGGYVSVKKRIFRTVANPWRRRCESDNDMAFGLNPPRGVLFHGKSGVGKTFAANCLSASLGLNVVKVRASDVLDQWLGGSEAAIRSLFQKARGAAPCILFLDEIDAIASNRDQEGCENDVSSRILTTLLNEMDGVSSKVDTNILVLACTNRLQDIDPALLRPGRLEEHIELQLPNYEDTKDILKLYLSKLSSCDGDAIISNVAQNLVDLEATGADIEGICRDAITFTINDREINEASHQIGGTALLRALAEWNM